MPRCQIPGEWYWRTPTWSTFVQQFWMQRAQHSLTSGRGTASDTLSCSDAVLWCGFKLNSFGTRIPVDIGWAFPKRKADSFWRGGTGDQTKDPRAAAGPWGVLALDGLWELQDKGWASACRATHSSSSRGAIQVISTPVCGSLAVWTAVLYNSARRSSVLALPPEKQNKQHLWLKLCFHCQMLFLLYIFGSHWWMIDTFNLKFHYC